MCKAATRGRGLRNRKRLPFPRGRGLVLLLGMGAVGYAGQAFCYFTAITMASAGLVSLLLYLYPALVTLLARVVFRHPLSGLQVGAVAIALAGSALTVGRAGDGKPLGIALGLLAALIYSCYILTGSRVPADIDPTTATAVIITGAAATCTCPLPRADGGRSWGWRWSARCWRSCSSSRG